MTKLGGLTRPTTKNTKVFIFSELVGHLGGCFLAKNHRYGTEKKEANSTTSDPPKKEKSPGPELSKIDGT